MFLKQSNLKNTAYPKHWGYNNPAAVKYTYFLWNINEMFSFFLLVIFQHSLRPAFLSPFISWTCVSSLTSAISHWLELPVQFQGNTDGSQMGSPAKQTSSLPCQNTQIQAHTLPAPCLFFPPSSVTRAPCQLMSLSTHLPVTLSQSDINLLNTRNLFMADNSNAIMLKPSTLASSQ